MKTRNSEVLKDFVKFCKSNPELRFWQAVWAWLRCTSLQIDGVDPFYWEGKNK